MTLTHAYAEDERQECKQCAVCGAQVYLEGVWPARVLPLSETGAALPPQPATNPPAKRRRTATEVIHELSQAKSLLDAGVLTQDQFDELKRRLSDGE